MIIVSSLQDQLASMQSQLDSANALLADNNRQIEFLTEQIRIMNQRQFGKKSESSLTDIDRQLNLFEYFNEAEFLENQLLAESDISEVVISSYKRSKSKGKREADLDGLPARIIPHVIPDDKLAELFPEEYKELPEEVYKRLHIIPETFMVDEHHVHVYASKTNDGKIVRAKRPADLLRNSIATAPLVAAIINGKYVNAVPLERQSKGYKCNGVNLSTNTMANWVIRCTEDYLSLIYDRLHEQFYKNKVIHADETPVKVMRIDGKKISDGKISYMWVYRNNPDLTDKSVILYDWQPSREHEHPREFLKAFSGTVVSYAYQAYHTLNDEREDITVAGCWVHARRPFAEFMKAMNKSKINRTIAEEAYTIIGEMMHIDNGFNDLPPRDRKRQRQLVLKDRVDAYFEWVKLKYSQVTHNGVIGKALAYSINQEKYLRVFLDDGRVPTDNNYAEQAIRPFTVGRKNFVLIESSNGAKASAMIYSLVETAKANGISTYKYFETFLSIIPRHMEDKNLGFLDELLPWSPYIQKECAIPKKQS